MRGPTGYCYFPTISISLVAMTHVVRNGHLFANGEPHKLALWLDMGYLRSLKSPYQNPGCIIRYWQELKNWTKKLVRPFNFETE